MSQENKPDKKSSKMRAIKTKCKDWPVIGKMLEPKPKVAVIRMSGVIADQSRKNNISYSKYAPLIEKAFAMNDIEEVALVINCSA